MLVYVEPRAAKRGRGSLLHAAPNHAIAVPSASALQVCCATSQPCLTKLMQRVDSQSGRAPLFWCVRPQHPLRHTPSLHACCCRHVTFCRRRWCIMRAGSCSPFIGTHFPGRFQREVFAAGRIRQLCIIATHSRHVVMCRMYPCGPPCGSTVGLRAAAVPPEVGRMLWEQGLAALRRTSRMQHHPSCTAPVGFGARRRARAGRVCFGCALCGTGSIIG